MLTKKLIDPHAEGIRPCLRCGRDLRIVCVRGEPFQVEVDPREGSAEYQTLVVKYDMHFQYCTGRSK